LVDVDSEEALVNGILELHQNYNFQNEVVSIAFIEAGRRRSSIKAKNLLNNVNYKISESKYFIV